MTSIVASLLMLAGLALVAGGIFALVRFRDSMRGVLMILAGLVMFGNVAIMTWPTG